MCGTEPKIIIDYFKIKSLDILKQKNYLEYKNIEDKKEVITSLLKKMNVNLQEDLYCLYSDSRLNFKLSPSFNSDGDIMNIDITSTNEFSEKILENQYYFLR